MTELLVTVAAAAGQRVLRRRRVRADRRPRRTVIEPLAERVAPGPVALSAMNQIPLMIAGAQLGITICSLGLGAIAEPALAHLLEAPFEALGCPRARCIRSRSCSPSASWSFLHTVIGEMVPKNITLAGPERAALVLGPPLAAVVHALKPVIVALNALANSVCGAAGRAPGRGGQRLQPGGGGGAGRPVAPGRPAGA